MAKKALLVGINDYKQINDCLNRQYIQRSFYPIKSIWPQTNTENY